MSKALTEGAILSIQLEETAWTIGQLCCRFELEGQKYKQYTMAFFDVLFSSEEELVENLDSLDLTKPIIITTLNRHPQRGYGLHLIGNKTISYTNVPNYKSDISPTLGLYKNKSTDFDHLLNAWFGFLPWDGFCREDYVDAFLTPGTKKRSDIRFMKDFTVEELKEIMPAGSIALIQHLQKDNVKKHFYIETWGCQMNEEDSEKLSGMLKRVGYTKTENKEDAGIILFNTCCVRENAEDKLFGKLGEVKKIKEKRGTIIAIGGCMMQEKHIVEKLQKSYPFFYILFLIIHFLLLYI